jgi:hypothetical protein
LLACFRRKTKTKKTALIQCVDFAHVLLLLLPIPKTIRARAAYVRTLLVLAVSLAAIALYQHQQRSRRQSTAVATEAVAREWRRRRLAVDLGAARASRHDALAAQTQALDRAVDLRQRLHSTTKGSGLTGNAAAVGLSLPGVRWLHGHVINWCFDCKITL